MNAIETKKLMTVAGKAWLSDTKDAYHDANIAHEQREVIRKLVEALKDAEFLLRKLSINPREAVLMTDSLKRSAEDARAQITEAAPYLD